MPVKHFTLYKRSLTALLIFAVLNILIGQFTHLDLIIEDYYFDATTHQFLWKNSWFAKDLMHGHVKYVITDIGSLLLLMVVLDFIYPWKIISPWLRARLRFVATASLIISGSVSLSKHFSTLHCPYDLTRYGGFAPFLRLFDPTPTSMRPGHCFPAGHATVGLWLAAFCVFWLPRQPKIALTVFFSGLSVGFALGWVQQMRGAHFLFHTLWAVWLAAFVIVVMLSINKELN